MIMEVPGFSTLFLNICDLAIYEFNAIFTPKMKGKLLKKASENDQEIPHIREYSFIS